jgi:predicted RNA binding protein YcfA (HicA-like mRNA interferase family)
MMGSSLYPRLVELLRAGGCTFVRQGKGSHEIWSSPVNGKQFSVPFTIKSKPTANAILRQAGLKTRI